MIAKIFYIDIKKPFSEYEKYLPLVSSSRRSRIDAAKPDATKTILLFSEIIARSEISTDLSLPFESISFMYGDYGKPYIENDSYHFSVSHSGNAIAYIASGVPIGIDIQQIKEPNKSVMNFFGEKDCEYINKSADFTNAFFEIWTSKEAYVKLKGHGINNAFRSIDIKAPLPNVLFATSRLPEHMLTVCTECTDISSFDYKIIPFEKLLESLHIS